MELKEFIKECSYKKSPIRDLTISILEDDNFSSLKTDKEIIEYLNFKTRQNGSYPTFQKLLVGYRKKTNRTLKFILNFLKENDIKSIKDAIKKGIATSYVETCGYVIKIPVGNAFPDNVMNDLEELESVNELWVEISDEQKVQSHMLTKPHINDGMNISFCSQEIQFKFLLSLIDDK